VEITADPDRLLQVLTNLLSNAIKFSPPNSAVSIVVRSGSGGVTLSIIDQGRGIPPDKLEIIFGRFQQVDASDSRLKGGSGLGLAICSAIVLQHNGRIWAECNPDRGSTFRVFLPYDPSTAAKSRVGSNNRHGRGLVLLAGANGAAQPLMAGQLADHGYRVMEAATVDQAVTAAHDGVEAIVLDTTPGGINGWEVLSLLRKGGPEAHTPVILLSVDTQQNHSEAPSEKKPSPLKNHALMGELVRVLGGSGELARILVVEDNPVLARVIGEAFSLQNATVKLAHSCQDAQEEYLAFLPHLLVLDLTLPDGGGFKLVNWLREREALARLPLVLYSGRELKQALPQRLTLEPVHLVNMARVQPRQLEALVLTMLRGSSQMEETLSED
jgi:CheY-like chemotaxis protein